MTARMPSAPSARWSPHLLLWCVLALAALYLTLEHRADRADIVLFLVFLMCPLVPLLLHLGHRSANR